MYFLEKDIDFSFFLCYNIIRELKSHKNMPVWWNWQTRRTQNPKVAIPCRFDPDYRHHERRKIYSSFVFLFAAEFSLYVILRERNIYRFIRPCFLNSSLNIKISNIRSITGITEKPPSEKQR